MGEGRDFLVRLDLLVGGALGEKVFGVAFFGLGFGWLVDGDRWGVDG